MAYEAEGRKIAQELRAQHGKLLEAHLKPGRRIQLVFERGDWEVPSNFIFKYGYSGSGPDCFHAFLTASGFTVSKSEVENGLEGQLLSAPGHDPKVHVLVLDDAGLKRGSTQELVDRARLHDEHEQAVKVMDAGNYRGAIAAFEKVLSKTDSPDPMTFQNIAVCYAHLGEFGRSLGVLEQALTRWPDHQRLRLNYEGIKADAPRGTVPVAPSWARQDQSAPKEAPSAPIAAPTPTAANDHVDRLRRVAAGCKSEMPGLAAQFRGNPKAALAQTLTLPAAGEKYFEKEFPPAEGWGTRVKVDASGSTLSEAVFGGMLLNGQLDGASFRSANLSHTLWSVWKLQDADFTGADLRDSVLYTQNCAGTRFTGADLSGATIIGLGSDPGHSVALDRSNLSGAKLHVALKSSRLDLTNANLSGCNVYPAGQNKKEQQQALDAFLATLNAEQRSQIVLEDSFKPRSETAGNESSTPPTKAGKCFIATAACGNASDWRVVALQDFRDTALRERRLGRLFIAAYERCSPPIAAVVVRFAILRAAVMVLVVCPAVAVLEFVGTHSGAPRGDGQR